MARPLALAAFSLLAAPLLIPPAQAQLPSYGQSVQEQQIYDNSPTGRPSGGILESGNPLELMNKLRRNSALDNATQPGDAIDQALKDLEAQAAPAPRTPGGALVTAP
ncbi:hypothetical protein I1E95_15130 [Synechococcus sp. CBW1107]|jgi:hypothetical protein|uniref:hypothetical protein n=1 Tax=Synechococcus sp. CBW1107 TaxID=2789857 RepID=UPI0018CCEC62|nr:hypothetical protein [Synechococcus sp. CBW1107]QPN56387.1 hypothetical protein I1E95_15130 [Synechococcus sp. CBW1107]CAK6697777.1 hypothetical protein BBFGKLBO_02321 [Synechococcus sp. CBW1107]